MSPRWCLGCPASPQGSLRGIQWDRHIGAGTSFAWPELPGCCLKRAGTPRAWAGHPHLGTTVGRPGVVLGSNGADAPGPGPEAVWVAGSGACRAHPDCSLSVGPPGDSS